MEKEESKQLIKEIDKSDLIYPNVVISPILGPITPNKLSGGVKALILVSNNPDTMFNITSCGGNCAKPLLEMSKDRDLYVNLRYMMDFGEGPFQIEVMNNGKIATNMLELIKYGNKYITGE